MLTKVCTLIRNGSSPMVIYSYRLCSISSAAPRMWHCSVKTSSISRLLPPYCFESDYWQGSYSSQCRYCHRARIFPNSELPAIGFVFICVWCQSQGTVPAPGDSGVWRGFCWKAFSSRRLKERVKSNIIYQNFFNNRIETYR